MAGSDMVVAHQGGWDEMLLVAVPVGIIVALLRVANRRADRSGRDQSSSAPPEDP